MMKQTLLAFAAILMTTVSMPVMAQDSDQEIIITTDEMKSTAAKAMRGLLPADKSTTAFMGALVSTFENNPTLKAARGETRAVFEQLPQAESGWKPRINANANITANSVSSELNGSQFGLPGTFQDDGDFVSRGASLNLNQPLYRGGRTLADIEAARNVIRAQLARLDGTEQQVLLSAVSAYLNVLRDEAVLKLVTNNRGVIAKQSDATGKRFDVGELTSTDVAQAQARLARADSDIITAQAALRSSRAEFERVIGYPAENLGYPITHIEIPPTLEEAIAYAEKWNPSVRAAEYAHEAAKNDADSQFGNLLPEIAIAGDLSKSYEPSTSVEESDSAAIGVVASIPLYEAGATRSRIRQAKKTAGQRYSQILEARRLARQQVASAWENLQAARAEVDSRLAQVEASEVARYGVKQEADLGARTILDTLDADQEVRDAQVALVQASRNDVVAMYSLAAAMGVLTPKTLGFGDKVPDYNREIEDVRSNLFSTDVDRQPGE